MRIEEISWVKSDLHVFWTEEAPKDFILQVYESENTFLNTLEGFAGDGFLKNECVVVIASDAHLELLNQRLAAQHFEVEKLIAEKKYFPISAAKSLAKFMANEMPVEAFFNVFVSTIISLAKKNAGRIRIFSEMMSILWQQGNNEGALWMIWWWKEFQHENQFCLFSAFPQNKFALSDITARNISRYYSKLIDGSSRPSTEIYYKSVRRI